MVVVVKYLSTDLAYRGMILLCFGINFPIYQFLFLDLIVAMNMHLK